MHKYLLPVSIKGVVFEKDSVWLRKNERDEWELPGGKLDEGEQPKETVVRELFEELGYKVEVSNIIQAYLYKINVSDDEKRGVLVVTYLCNIIEKTGDFEHKGEAGRAEFKKFSIDEAVLLNMPKFYKEAINKAWKTFKQASES